MTLTIKRAEKIVPLCLDLSLKADHERAEDTLKRAIENTDRREADTSVREAAEAVRQLEDAMREHTVFFTIQAMRRKDWVEFEESHPARAGHDDDKAYDLDLSALDEAISASIVAVKSSTGEDVPLVPAKDWPALADEMSNAQWQAFAIAVLQANRGVVVTPFSQTASLEIRRSAPTSS